MKVRKMERAENSDLDTSLAPGKYGNILQEQEFRRKVPSEYANLRIQLGKEIYVLCIIEYCRPSSIYITWSFTYQNVVV